MTLEEEVALLRTENQELREELSAAGERIAELERGQKGPPSFVKANRAKSRQVKPRQARGRAEWEPQAGEAHACSGMR